MAATLATWWRSATASCPGARARPRPAPPAQPVAAAGSSRDPAHRRPGRVRLPRRVLGVTELDRTTWLHAPHSHVLPAPPERLWECLDPFQRYLHADRTLPPLLGVAFLHYQFEAIHPFVDGNGRVGRLLVVLLMAEWDLLPDPLLDLSAYIEPRRDEYYARLLAVSTEGDWRAWAEFFLEAVQHQAIDALERVRQLQRLRDDYRARFATARSSGLLGTLVDALFDTPVVTIPRVGRLLGVTHRAARLNIDKLMDAGILAEVGNRARNKLFMAAAVLRAVEGAPPPAVARVRLARDSGED